MRPSVEDRGSFATLLARDTEAARRNLNSPKPWKRFLKRWQSTDSNSKIRERIYCGCFRTRTGCLSACLVIWLLILSIFGVGTFLMYPRIPSIRVSKAFFPMGAFGLDYNITDRGTIDTISYPVSVNFTVNSENYIDIACKEITVQVSYF